MDVVGLGAWCDLDSEDEDRQRTASFRVSEFAVLADGRRLVLHDERGFSTSSSSGDAWQSMTLELLEADVRTTVLPDDDDTEDEHPWEWLVELVRAHGVDASVDQLRSVPYKVEFSERLVSRLRRA